MHYLIHIFFKKYKGGYFKCCDGCKKKRQKVTSSPEQVVTTDEITADDARIPLARLDFIQGTILNSDEALEYLGPVNPDEVDTNRFKLELTGKEHFIEYHAFKIIGTDGVMLVRWRATFKAGLRQNIYIGPI